MNNPKVIKINYLQKKYWYVPTVLTSSKRKWLPRPYNNLKKLLVTENFFEKDFILSLNRDTNLIYFRMIQSWKNHAIFFNKKDLALLSSQGYVEEKITHSNIYLRYDQTSLRHLQKGYLPYFGNAYLKQEQHFSDKKFDKYILIWRKNGWKEEKLTPSLKFKKITNFFKSS